MLGGRFVVTLRLPTTHPKLYNHLMNNLQQILINHTSYSPIIPQEFLQTQPHIFNFTKNNPALSGIDVGNIQTFSAYINATLQKTNKTWGAGGYGEDRVLYVSPLFTKPGEEPRSIHLGVDLWMPAGTKIFSPLPGFIHSFQDNNHYLDYGPTIILEHELEGTRFYTLYGHLSRSSLVGLAVGQTIEAGQQIATLGDQNENGSWPPHLHFQVISDMLGKSGDFPGVAKPSERDYYLNLCPDPNLILRIPALKI